MSPGSAEVSSELLMFGEHLEETFPSGMGPRQMTSLGKAVQAHRHWWDCVG